MNLLRLFRRNDQTATRCQIVIKFTSAIQHQRWAGDFLWPAGQRRQGHVMVAGYRKAAMKAAWFTEPPLPAPQWRRVEATVLSAGIALWLTTFARPRRSITNSVRSPYCWFCRRRPVQ